MKRLMILAAIIGVSVIGGDSAMTAPEPKSISDAWRIDFTLIEHLRTIEVTPAGADKPQTFWFMIYNITNHTDRTRVFVPDFTIYTDTGEVLHTSGQAPPEVFKKIKTLYDRPLLTDRLAMTGELLCGADNAKDGVAVFPNIESRAGAFDLFVAGLSGELATVVLPKPITVTDELTGEKTTKNRVVLAKTLSLHYKIPGEAEARRLNPAKLTDKTWIMR